MTVVIDLNVLLDVLQNREPHVRASSAVLSLALDRKMGGRMAAHAITTLHYILARHLSREKAGEAIDWVLSRFQVVAVGPDDLRRARALRMSDFEDAVVSALAERCAATCIVTRNVGDFRASPVPAVTPEEFLSRFVK